MANKTVYPYGTGGQLPSSIGIINDLITGGADKALAAEQGKVLGGLLIDTTEIDLSAAYKYNYYIDDNNLWYNATTTVKVRCCLIPINGAFSFRCTASGGYCTFALLKSDTRSNGTSPDFASGYPAKFGISDGTTGTFDIPSDAKFLYVFAQTSSGTDITGRYGNLAFSVSILATLAKGENEKTIVPHCSYYTLKTSDGDKSGNYYGTGAWTTTRYIGVRGSFSIKLGATRRVSVYKYDKDFSFIERTVIPEVVADTETNFVIGADVSYIKLVLLVDENASGNAKCTVELTGDFPDDWDTYNARSSDSGYQRIVLPVRVTDPTCCDTVTDSVQDASQILPDYGVICLPEQYSVNGEPTRLIIYCHGAGVNYSASVSRFDSQDLDPTYWLAEGYAVMDIEGNPFNNTDEHFWVPQAIDSYVGAYKWAIEYYNICRDGVFLGGRSMGGGMVFALMRSGVSIPILGACPNVPSACAMGTSTAVRKEFWATHCGFDIPSGYTFGNSTYTDNDKSLFLANWDKLVKYNPILSQVTDLPITAEGKQDVVDSFSAYSDERVALWETLHLPARCPVKLFACNQDENCIPAYTSEVFYRMLINAGQNAELRLFNSYKDYSGTGTSAHHYDTQDPALRADITTSFGEELEDVPIVYIEMLAFWRRYEQGL